MISVRARDIAERVFWTFIVASLSNLVGVTLLGVDMWKGAAMAGLSAVINVVIAIARWRLSILPDPGAAVAEAARAKTLDEVKTLEQAA